MVDRSNIWLRALGKVSSVEELQGVNTYQLRTGATVFVESIGAHYTFLEHASEAPDNGLIVAPNVGRGRWFFATQVGPTAQSELQINTTADLYLDPQNVTGNANDMGPASITVPMLTATGFSQRFGRAVDMQDTTLHLLSEGNDGDPLVLDRFLATPKLGTGFFIRGPAPTVLYSGTLTDVTNEDSATNQPLVLEIDEPGFDWDTAGPGGTSLIGHRVRMVTGSNPGSVCWLAARLSATQAIANRLLNISTYASSVWAPGNQLVVESFTRCPDLYIKCAGGAAYAEVVDLAVRNHVTCVGRIWFKGCDLGPVDLLYNGGEAVYLSGCKFGGSGQFSGVVVSGMLTIDGGLTRVTGVENARRLYLGEHGLNYGTVFSATNTTVELAHGGFGFMNWASGPAITLRTDCHLEIGNGDRLWGTTSSPNTYGLRMFGGGIGAYNTLPTLRGTETSTANGGTNVRDLRLATTNYFWEDLPQGFATNSAVMVVAR